MFSTAENCIRSDLLYKQVCVFFLCFFFRVCNYLRPSKNSRQLIFNINVVVLIVIIC